MMQTSQQSTGGLAKASKHGSVVSREKLVRCEIAGEKATPNVNFPQPSALFGKPVVLNSMSKQKSSRRGHLR